MIRLLKLIEMLNNESFYILYLKELSALVENKIFNLYSRMYQDDLSVTDQIKLEKRQVLHCMRKECKVIFFFLLMSEVCSDNRITFHVTSEVRETIPCKASILNFRCTHLLSFERQRRRAFSFDKHFSHSFAVVHPCRRHTCRKFVCAMTSV